MKVIHSVAELSRELAGSCHSAGKSVGLVPTMGALHEGHASLVRRAVAENDAVVVSVFVNPTQFNDPTDLEKYPRTLADDCRLLESLGVTYVFAPSVEEIYPEPDTRVFRFPPLDEVMEGPRRPGHFNGVAQIVSKLFAYVKPTCAYFGEKDFQQLAIVRRLVEQLGLDLQIVGCPIQRESDGLALSSRNKLLTSEQRSQAVAISRTLFESKKYMESGHSLAETKDFVEKAIASAPGLELEYFEIVDGDTLQSLEEWADSDYVVGCITVHCGSVRLIDNLKYKVRG